jgi:hypothetical protein
LLGIRYQAVYRTVVGPGTWGLENVNKGMAPDGMRQATCRSVDMFQLPKTNAENARQPEPQLTLVPPERHIQTTRYRDNYP